MRPILMVVGTRPEGIKMIPIYWALKQQKIPVILCSTTQHRQLLQKIFDLFCVQPDIEFDIMQPQQDLFHITARVINKMRELLVALSPVAVMVQGDTTSAMASALSAFYLKIPIFHVEAGLRTQSITSPFPEEMNRRFISQLATLHFTPTSQATENLLREHVSQESIIQTGNTIVDALHWIIKRIDEETLQISPFLKQLVNSCNHQNIIVFTMHRRESLDDGIISALHAMKKILDHYEDMVCIFAQHPNPRIAHALQASGITAHTRFHCIEALDYHDFIYLLQHAFVIMTDSGGIQEEAASLGKYTFVVRDQTERTESIHAGLSCLVGTQQDAILTAFARFKNLKSNIQQTMLYGDGHAAQRIAHSVATFYESMHPITSVKISSDIEKEIA